MNRDSYNEIAASWDEARTAFAGRERDYLDTFLSSLPVPSPILDLGCGTGRPIAEYILAGVINRRALIRQQVYWNRRVLDCRRGYGSNLVSRST
jgi:SAM-dependent methyltransferase